MKTLHDVKSGQLFYVADSFEAKEYITPTVVKPIPIRSHKERLGVRLKDESNLYCSCFLDVKHQLIAPEALVCQIATISDFSLNIGKIKREVIPLIDVEDSMVFELPTGNGLISLFCATNKYIFTGRVCLSLGWPSVLSSEEDVSCAGTWDDLSKVI